MNGPFIIRHMRVLLIIALLLVQAGLVFGKSKIAVLDFYRYEGLEKKVLSEMADQFEFELKKQDNYQLFERKDFDRILVDKGISGLRYCDSIQCFIESGHVFGVDKVITGSLRRFGKAYAVHVQLIEVKSGFPEHTFSFEIRGSLRKIQNVGSVKAAAYFNKYATIPFKPEIQAGKSIKEIELELGHEIDLRIKRSVEDKKSRLLQVSLFALGALAGGTGLYFETQVQDSEEVYDSFDGYKSNGKTNNEWTEVEDNMLKRNLMYSLSLAVLATGISYTVFF